MMTYYATISYVRFKIVLFARYQSHTRYKLVSSLHMDSAQSITASSAINDFHSCILWRPGHSLHENPQSCICSNDSQPLYTLQSLFATVHSYKYRLQSWLYYATMHVMWGGGDRHSLHLYWNRLGFLCQSVLWILHYPWCYV